MKNCPKKVILKDILLYQLVGSQQGVCKVQVVRFSGK